MTRLQNLRSRLREQLALGHDLGRAARVCAAFAVPLAVAHALGRPSAGVFVALTAQTISLPDLRGAYKMRLLILGTMTIVAAGSALLGVVAGGHLVSTVAAMGFIALLGGFWRHLSAEYGPSLSSSSALLLLLGFARPGPFSTGLELAGLIILGGAWAALLQIGFWAFRPQHALRQVVAECWLAASDLIASMRPEAAMDDPLRSEAIPAGERELRATLDRTFIVLGAAEGRKPSPLIAHLEEMRREVVHFTMRVTALHAALEPLGRRPDFARHAPAADSAIQALSEAARSMAITLITHRPENFALSEVRLQLCGNLLRVLDEQLALEPAGEAITQVRAAFPPIIDLLPRMGAALGETVDHGSGRFSVPATLPEVRKQSVSSLAAWINPAPQLDPVLVRHTLRMAVLTMLAVAIYKGFEIPRGYWIAFTIVVVLQPDYGSTRQKAGQRIGGTLAGGLLGSTLVWIKLPHFAVDGCAALMSFGFAYFLKRSYGSAVIFVTLLVVLITETTAPIGLELTLTRLLCTVSGGAVALISALIFWPIWEGEKYAILLSAAIRANHTYLDAIILRLNAEDPGKNDLLMVKRRAENANRYAVASLQRMLAEPGVPKPTAERAATLSTYNQRITRAFTAMAVHLESGLDHDVCAVVAAREIGLALESLAQAIEAEAKNPAGAETCAKACKLDALFAQGELGARRADGSPPPQHILIRTQLAKTIAEIRAMALALKPAESVARGSFRDTTATLAASTQAKRA